MTADSDGFLGRWARRKALARNGVKLSPEPARVELPAAPVAPVPAAGNPVQPASVDDVALPAARGLDAGAPPVDSEQPAPTLADAQQLTPASDFRPFVARTVAPEVRNTAFRKLFADPRFNVMDGLDIYIDDYSRPDPLPLEVARELLAAQFPQALAGRTTQAATLPACGSQAAAAVETHAVDSAPDPSDALPRADAAQNGAGPSGCAGSASTDDSQRDHLSTDPQE